MICLMFFCGCKVLQINFLDSESEIVKTIRIALSVLLLISFSFTVFPFIKGYFDCRQDHELSRKAMLENDRVAKENDINRSFDSEFMKGQKANAEVLKESYLQGIDFIKNTSDTVLKYCAAFAAIWLNVSF